MLAFDSLHSRLGEVEENASQSVETGGYKLTLNAIRDFETEKLAFLETELGECDLPPADVVRCMNVFVYFDAQTRLRMMTQAGRMLDEGGILLSGTNQASGQYRRYVVYRKKREHLNPAEFAFSPDTLRPLSMMPWFTIHEEDPEATLLAELISAVRSNESFWKDFSARVDALLEQHDICRRSAHGFLVSPVKQKSIPELREPISALWQQIITEGYLAGVVNALCAAGYNAFENIIGDIAIRPTAGCMFRPYRLPEKSDAFNLAETTTIQFRCTGGDSDYVSNGKYFTRRCRLYNRWRCNPGRYSGYTQRPGAGSKSFSPLRYLDGNTIPG